MSRKPILSQKDPMGNDQPVGDVQQSDGVDFNLADLESIGDPASKTGPDPFDPESLRLSDDDAGRIGVRKVLLSVPVRKPDKSWFVRVHPDPAYRMPTAVIDLKEDRETYLIARALWPELATESTFKRLTLYTAINRQCVLFLWPIPLPGPDGKDLDWYRTARDAANKATRSWVRVTANMSAGAYDLYEATGSLPKPEWPDVPFQELLRLAFKDRFIDKLDHPVLRKLRGEV